MLHKLTIEELREIYIHKTELSDAELELYHENEIAKVAKVADLAYNKNKLNLQRNNELKGFIIDNILMNEDTIKTMAVSFNIATDDEQIEWIDIENKVVAFNKTDFGALIKKGSNKVKEIYFRYRKLKDEIK